MHNKQILQPFFAYSTGSRLLLTEQKTQGSGHHFLVVGKKSLAVNVTVSRFICLFLLLLLKMKPF